MAVLRGLTQARAEADMDEVDHTLNAQNQASTFMGSVISLFVLMIIFIVTRIYCRAVLLRKMGGDDWCMIFAAVRNTSFGIDLVS